MDMSKKSRWFEIATFCYHCRKSSTTPAVSIHNGKILCGACYKEKQSKNLKNSDWLPLSECLRCGKENEPYIVDQEGGYICHFCKDKNDDFQKRCEVCGNLASHYTKLSWMHWSDQESIATQMCYYCSVHNKNIKAKQHISGYTITLIGEGYFDIVNNKYVAEWP